MKYTLIALASFIFAHAAIAQKGLAVGAKAPDFTAIDQFGKTISLNESLKNGPVVVVFYRGYWCPNCMRALKSIQDSLVELSFKKATVIAISPEAKEGIAKSAKISKATYSLVSDEGLKILKAYDVAFTITKDMKDVHKQYNIDVAGNNGANGNILPRPAAFIINTEGIITYRFFNTEPYSNTNSTVRITVNGLLSELSK